MHTDDRFGACNLQAPQTETLEAKPGKGFDYGLVDKGHYKNDFFNFEIDLPKNWVLQSQDQKEHIMQSGENMIAGNDENMRAAIQEIDVTSANLVTVFQHELGAAVDYNPNLMLLAENLKQAPGVLTGADYLFHSRKLLTHSALKFEHIDETFKPMNIGGRTFYLMAVDLKYMGLDIHQLYCSTIEKGFSLSIILSYVSDEQKEILMQSLQSLRFK